VNAPTTAYARGNIEGLCAEHGSPARWLAAVIITAIVGDVLILQSLQFGALALPPVYDDISYFNDGAYRLLAFYRSGLADLFSNLKAGPPHAPLSTALAFSGFSVFGIHAWAAVAANAVLLLFFVRAFLAYAKKLPVGLAILLSLALLGAPFFGRAVLEFRPDMFCSLLIGVGTVGVLATPWPESRRIQVIAGMLFGLALLAKPTVFHLTAALFFAAMFLASCPFFFFRKFARPIAALVITTSVALAIALPYYLVAWHHVLNYIWTTIFGTEASIWVRPLPFRDHVLFYLTGETGRTSLGKWLYVGAAVGIAALWTLWLRAPRHVAVRASLTAAMVVVSYLAVTIPSFKGPHGLPFAAIFLCAVALATVELSMRLPRPTAWAFGVLLTVFSFWQFQWPYAGEPVDSDFARSRWEIVDKAFQAIKSDAVGKVFMLTTSAVYINPSVLELEFHKQGLWPPTLDDVQRIGDLAEHRRRMAQADIIFALTPDFKDVFPQLPTSTPEFRADLIKTIDGSGLFQAPVYIPDPIRGGSVVIYRALPSFGAFSGVKNLQDIEGPYPQWSLPLVRWGSGASTELTAEGLPGSTAKLFIQARTVPIPSQTLAVLVDGRTQLDPVQMTYAFQAFEIPFTYDSHGRAAITLRYGTAGPQAVLFKALVIR
jgi:hypothetical protein